ncbi:Glycine cleavage system H protein [Pontiella desulfatans]|uniref:Glycine cleavage system H protein n=1 Tax=Pontiella desulfatans TaxID=2750659 RepID=A0A6C2U3Q4_PONDE|nr:glycine cleavage system protein GcvH [Pontiella desulfatans]VGO14523.1 Glycine cleavage system H protein [Pontiella desulfatans]
MSVPQDLFYAKTHEWVSLDDGIATVGISDFAQSQLSDLTFVELPEVGTEFSAGDEAAVVESVKAAADVYAPVGGEIIEVNSELEDNPELINKDAFGAGWLFKIRVNDESEVDDMMDADSYEELCPDD